MIDDSQDRQARQVEQLMAYRRIGPLKPEAIAVNLSVSPEELRSILEKLVADRRLIRLSDGRLVSKLDTASDGRRPGPGVPPH